MNENKKLLSVFFIFLAFYFIPFSDPNFSNALISGFNMLNEYARDHVIFCLVPAFFIAGAITVFLNQQSVLKYLGANAKKIVAYSFASISGAILSVCSCTILPIFKGIYKKGAGLGPAISFLYSGPAINIMAILLTAKVLGLKIGIARAIFAIIFSVIIGFIMHLLFEDKNKIEKVNFFLENSEDKIWLNSLFVFLWIFVLIFLNWGQDKAGIGLWSFLYRIKYILAGSGFLGILYLIIKYYKKEKIIDWLNETRNFGIQIIPLLFSGVLIAGFLLGNSNSRGIIPSQFISQLVGGNSILSNLIASISGSIMYFATLTEVPIVQGLLNSGMGQGPALALLLAGPSISLPSILVINSELGPKKTFTYIILIIVMSTLAGVFFGNIVG